MKATQISIIIMLSVLTIMQYIHYIETNKLNEKLQQIESRQILELKYIESKCILDSLN